jgi:hypothetical protein
MGPRNAGLWQALLRCNGNSRRRNSPRRHCASGHGHHLKHGTDALRSAIPFFDGESCGGGYCAWSPGTGRARANPRCRHRSLPDLSDWGGPGHCALRGAFARCRGEQRPRTHNAHFERPPPISCSSTSAYRSAASKPCSVLPKIAPVASSWVLTALDDVASVSRALARGAKGYILKGISGSELVAHSRPFTPACLTSRLNWPHAC